jgi:hypothetical protein
LLGDPLSVSPQSPAKELLSVFTGGSRLAWSEGVGSKEAADPKLAHPGSALGAGGWTAGGGTAEGVGSSPRRFS